MRCSRLSQVKHWDTKASNLFFLSLSTNVLITRRASLSPWRGRGTWWSPPSGCRRRRSSKLTNRDLRQKRSEGGIFTNQWHWCDCEINFCKTFFYWNDSSGFWTCTAVRARLHTLTHNIQVEDGRHIHCRFTKAQSYSCYTVFTLSWIQGLRNILYLKGGIQENTHRASLHRLYPMKPCER